MAGAFTAGAFTVPAATAFAANLSAFLTLAFALFNLFLGLLFGRMLPTKPCCLLRCLLLIVYGLR